jgi:hypothetical protein
MNKLIIDDEGNHDGDGNGWGDGYYNSDGRGAGNVWYHNEDVAAYIYDGSGGKMNGWGCGGGYSDGSGYGIGDADLPPSEW